MRRPAPAVLWVNTSAIGFDPAARSDDGRPEPRRRLPSSGRPRTATGRGRTGMIVGSVCMSHSPLMANNRARPETEKRFEAAVAQAAAHVAQLKPDLTVLFYPDHINGFFYELLPSFCVGIEGRSIGDYGTRAGPLDIPQDRAMDLARSVHRRRRRHGDFLPHGCRPRRGAADRPAVGPPRPDADDPDLRQQRRRAAADLCPGSRAGRRGRRLGPAGARADRAGGIRRAVARSADARAGHRGARGAQAADRGRRSQRRPARGARGPRRRRGPRHGGGHLDAAAA